MSESEWQKSSYCGGGGNNCVEVRLRAGSAQIRESDQPATVVTATPAGLRALVLAIKTGAFDHLLP